MKLEPHYMTYTEFDSGFGVCDPTDFDKAVDLFAEYMGGWNKGLVFRMEPGTKGKAGMMIDVTDDAIACVAKRCRLRNEDMPEWLVEAMQIGESK